ncbi:c-type cytochrome [Cribrihabitans neustonicus]|uniref:c-type cytochrome n=1 Tax=Cribrihabitans neustonicus TaxID=1429085 RepID=UPI003B5C7AF2
MRWILTGAAAAAVFGGSVIAALAAWPIGEEPDLPELEGDVARGAYLARASGCIACHTDTEGGGKPLAGGAPLATDFGTFYPPNLTTDPGYGIGGWTQKDFARAVRQGISPSGEPYYPTFTYPFYANFTDQDIADLWAAFQTVPPVAEPDRPHDTSFPFDQRWGLKLWRAAFLEPPETGPVPGKSEQWNRGRALVEGAAHCAACHTGRNLAGARVPELRFKGNDRLPGGSKAPPIDPASLREKGWDADALAYGLKTGLTPSGDAMGGSMGEVVFQGTAFLTDEDRRAMAAYLMDPAAGG